MTNTRGWLDGVVLALVATDPMHGYGIANKMADAGLSDVPSGTLYPLLKKLHTAGLLDATWSTDEPGPAKKVYSLTAAGADALSDIRANWLESRRLIDLLLDVKSSPEVKAR